MGKRPHKTLATVQKLKVEKMHQMVTMNVTIRKVFGCYDWESPFYKHVLQEEQ